MKTLKTLRRLQSSLGAEVFLVGGAVRDRIRRKEPNDLDFVVRGVAPADFEAFMRRRGRLELVGESFGVYLFTTKGSEERSVEIAFPRKEVSTGPDHKDFNVICDPKISIEEDARRRDFTCNAMYVDLSNVDDNGKFDRKSVIDFHNGLGHIKARLVVAVGNPEDRILEDPLRMLRALVLIARTRYRLEGSTFGAIKKHAQLLSTVAKERIHDEFDKIMETDKPSVALKAMQRTGLLKVFFPELADCVGKGQNSKYHSYNVFDHSIYATDAACSLTKDPKVRYAALCHDLGKAPTRAIKPAAEGGTGPEDVTFHNHEVVSTRLAFAFLSRYRYPKRFTEEVIGLVRQHQYKYDREWTDKALRRFIRKVGMVRADLEDLDNFPLFLIRQADRMGNKLKEHLPITQKQRDFQKRLIVTYEQSSAHSLRDLKVNGKDLMAEFDLPASPVIGNIIDYLFDVVEETPNLNTKEGLLRLAEEFLRGQEETNGDQDRKNNLSRGRARREESC
jgi:poly(A) polymerase/tRNA nucleotidyltransferase (CCA-adding enzyme)